MNMRIFVDVRVEIYWERVPLKGIIRDIQWELEEEEEIQKKGEGET